MWQGVATEVLNPKTALFFLSFIPQFVNRSAGHVFLQFIVLGTISVCLNTSADLVVTFLAGPLGARIRSSSTFRRRQRTVTGLIMLGWAPTWRPAKRSRSDLDQLVIEAVGTDFPVYLLKKIVAVAGQKINAAHFTLLQSCQDKARC